MYKRGLCSISFRKLSVKDIIEAAVKGGIEVIEWGGDAHVPHGDIETAKKVRDLTLSSSLKIETYGSYYRAGVSESEGLAFSDVLASAKALGAGTIRIWVGNRNFEDTYRNTVIKDIIRVAGMAFEDDIHIAMEYHQHTLTNTNEAAYILMEAMPEENISFYWQPHNKYTDDECLEAITKLKHKISHVHVFQWQLEQGQVQRKLLAEGQDRWRGFLSALHNEKQDRCAFLEFSKDNKIDNFLQDAAVLKGLCSNLNN
jgi:sugar phosphate isomerase/epimerase